MNGTDSMLARFEGKEGRRRLVSLLQQNTLVNGDLELAEELAKDLEIEEYEPGERVFKQGDVDSEFYLILSGSIGIEVSDKEIAQRRAGKYFGDMTPIDASAFRSASVKTKEHTVVGHINERRFSQLAAKYPKLWRTLALEFAARIRQRNELDDQQNSEKQDTEKKAPIGIAESFDPDNLTVGELIKLLRPSQLWGVIAALITLMTLSASIATHFAK